MRKVLLLLAGFSLLGVFSMPLRATPKQAPEVDIVKKRQKEERRELKLKDHYAKAMFKGQRIPKGVRDQQKHELQRERRALRDRQKAELQDMRDRERIYKDSLRAQ